MRNGTFYTDVVEFSVTTSAPVAGLTLAHLNLQLLDVVTLASQSNFVASLAGSGDAYLLSIQIVAPFQPRLLRMHVDAAPVGVAPPVAAVPQLDFEYQPPQVAFNYSHEQAHAHTMEFTATFSRHVSNVTLAAFEWDIVPASAAVTPTLVLSNRVALLRFVLQQRVQTSVTVRVTGATAATLVPPVSAASSPTVTYNPHAVTLSTSLAAPSHAFASTLTVVTATFSDAVVGVDESTFVVTVPSGANARVTSVEQSSGNPLVYHATVTTLALPPQQAFMPLTVSVQQDSVVPPVQGDSLQLLYSPPWPVLSSSHGLDGVSTEDTTFTFTATFKDSFTQADAAVSGVTASTFDLQSSNPDSNYGVTLGNPSGSTWTLTVTIQEPEVPSSFSVGIQPRSPGVQPANAASSGRWTVRFSPPAATIKVAYPGTASVAANGFVPSCFTITVVVNALVSGATSSVLGLRFDEYLAGASVTSFTELGNTPVGFTTLVAHVQLPEAVYQASVAIDLQGGLTTPPFVAPEPFVVNYRCNSTTSTVCGQQRRVFNIEQSPRSVSAASIGFTPSGASTAGLTYQWNLLQASGGTELPTTATSQTLDVEGFPVGLTRLGVTVRSSARPLLWVTSDVWVYVFRLQAEAPLGPHQGNDALWLGVSARYRWQGLWPATGVFQVTLTRSGGSQAAVKRLLPPQSDSTPREVRLTVPRDAPAGNYEMSVDMVSDGLFDLPVVAGAQPLTLATSRTVSQVSPLSVVAGAWSSCSSFCGRGIRRRSVWCVAGIGEVPVMVPSRLCTSLGLSWPATWEWCEATQACPTAYWHAGAWGACSVGCGFGQQSRNVTCLSPDGTTSAEGCPDAIRPNATQACSRFECDRYVWTAFAWSRCTQGSCLGERYRHVQCTVAGVDSAHVPNELCDASTKPRERETCSSTSMPECGGARWKLGTLSACSKLCGTGVAKRSVTCVVNASDTVVDDAECVDSGAGPKPEDSIPCNTQPCLRLHLGVWGGCGVPCGGGIQSRQASCYNLGQRVSMVECYNAGMVPWVADVEPGVTQLTETRPCNKHHCPAPRFCDTPNVCGANGTCIVALDACQCHNNFTGTFCQVPPGCPPGVLGVEDKNGDCCVGTLISAEDRTCCPSGIVTPQGLCCPPGTTRLDGCGRCATASSAEVAIDRVGTCCNVRRMTIDRFCCSGRVDDCGVCNGVGACPRETEVVFNSSVYHTPVALYTTGALPLYLADLQSKAHLTSGTSISTKDLRVVSVEQVARVVYCGCTIAGPDMVCLWLCVFPGWIVECDVLCSDRGSGSRH